MFRTLILAFLSLRCIANLEETLVSNTHQLINYNASKELCAKDICTKVHITMKKFTDISLKKALEIASQSNDYVRIFHVTFRTEPDANSISLIGKLIDEFLTPRPWWTVVQEPYVWHSKHLGSIVLEKVMHTYEPYLRLISSIQYPESNVCDKSMMFLSLAGCTHPGWASVLTGIFGMRLKYPYHISTTYVIGNAGWILPRECDKADKWECAFLPMTNCTKPEVLTSYNVSAHSNKEFNAKFEDKQSFYPSNASGLQFNSTNNFVWKPEMSNTPRNEQQTVLSKYLITPSLLGNKSTSKYMYRASGSEHSAKSVYDNHFILRNNHRFRSLIAEQKHKFHHHGLTVHTRCVAAHVRRGDRVGSFRGNWTEVCYNATRPITAINKQNLCQDNSGKLGDCKGYLIDKACDQVVSFGAVTIEMLIENAEKMVSNEVRNLFLFTDDESWALKEIARARKVYPKWTVNLFEAPKHPPPPSPYNLTAKSQTKYDKMVDSHSAFMDKGSYPGFSLLRFYGGAVAGAVFLGSLQLAQQCEALIGHQTSAVPDLFFNAMCLRHGNNKHYGICPPLFNVGIGPRTDKL